MNSLRVILFLFITLVLSPVAQAKEKDSIDIRLEQASHDSTRLRLLNNYSRKLVQSDIERAHKLSNQALILANRLNNPAALSTALDHQGLVFEHQGDYQRSLNLFLSSLRIREKLNNQREIARSLNNVGVICWYMKKYELAKSYYLKGLKINEEIKDTGGVATILGNLGIICDEEGNQEAALKYYARAMDIFTLLKDDLSIAACLSNMGLIYSNRKELQKAEHAYREALRLRESANDRQGIAISLNNIGVLYEQQGKHTEAIRHYKRSLEISRELKSKEDIRENFKNLSNTYASTKRFDSAYHYLHYLMTIKDSILNEENDRSFHELESKYQSEKKEQEIELLRKEKQIESANQQAALQKEKLFRNTMLGGMIMFLFAAVMLFNRSQVKQKANKLLEQKNEAIRNQKLEIELAHNELEAKNKDITDSIRYAKRIQEAIFPPETLFKEYLPDSFILYKPKDIVSGDFYWMEHRNRKTYVAAVDCTGHGVPGSLMSIVGHGVIKQAVIEHKKEKPSEILDELNRGITETLRQTYENSSVKDGMDLAMCCIDHQNLTLEYAGAYNPLWLIRNGELREIKADKIPVGMFEGEEVRKFTNHLIHLLPGDVFYIFTDGFADQFGGPQGKKFKYKTLADKLLQIHKESFDSQKNLLENAFAQWRGNLEQVDDVLVIGFKVS